MNALNLKCRICSGTNLYKFLSLGHQPPSDAFLSEEQLNGPETYYPLDVYFCDDCKLVQLGYTIDPKELFSEEYAYNTGTSKELIKNFSELTKKLVESFNLSNEDLAIDIGSNDGTLLEGYLKYNIKILGVEPTGTANLALNKNIPTIKEFFNKELAKKILIDHKKAKVITATNVFAHVNNLTDFIEGIKLLLTDDGIFVSESHYLLNLIEKMQYDSIYHEHLRYYSLKPLIYLFNLYDMDVFDAEVITTHGGSIRVYTCKKGAYPISNSINDILTQEEKSGLYSKERFIQYAKEVSNSKTELKKLLWDIKENKKENIVGIGAPAKGNTLLNYCQIDKNILDYIAEYSKLKINKYCPGSHIKIIDEEILFREQPKYALLLSWNMKDLIVPKLRDKGYKGKIIISVPKCEILE